MYRDILVSTHKRWRSGDTEHGIARVLDHDQSKREAYEPNTESRLTHPRKARVPLNTIGLWSFDGKVSR